MSKHSSAVVSVKILPNATSASAGKLADAGPFKGLKLVGFAVWGTT